VYELPAGSLAVDGANATAATHNTPIQDIEDDLNIARSIATGGTGAATASLAFDNIVLPRLLGTVSQSSGTPTGAIIETGSNANGFYIRFANGLQICLSAALTFSYLNTTALSVTWTFPAAFAGDPAPTWFSLMTLPFASGQYTGVSFGSVAYLAVDHTDLFQASATLSLIKTEGTASFDSGDSIANVRVAAFGFWFDTTA
jgi:hypothetical protein